MGETVQASATKWRRWGVAVLVLGVVLAGPVVSAWTLRGPASASPAPQPAPTLTASQAWRIAETATYDDLARYTERYEGVALRYKGRVIQVTELGSDQYVLRVHVDSAGIVWLNHRGARLLEGDVVDFVAVVDGRRTYQAVLGNSVTLPELTSLFLIRADD